MILEVSATCGDVWVGIVGKNFNSEGPWWNQKFFDIKNEKKMLVTACCSKDGTMYKNGCEQATSKAKTFGDAGGIKRIQMEVRVQAPPSHPGRHARALACTPWLCPHRDRASRVPRRCGVRST